MATAILYSAVETAAERFPQYLIEMEQFFTDHGVSTRSVNALTRVMSDLGSDQILREDLLSMLQVMRMAEPEISTLEVLAILLLAISGARNASELQQNGVSEGPARELFHFVKNAMRPAAANEAAPQEEPASAGSAFPMEEQLPVEWAAALPVVTPATQGAGLRRALALAAEEETFEADKTLPLPQGDRAEQAWASRVRVAPSSPVRPLPPDRANRWVYAGCGIVLGLLLGFFVERQKPSPSRESVPAVSETAGDVHAPVIPDRGERVARSLPGRHMTAAGKSAATRERTAPEARGEGGPAPVTAVAPPANVEAARAVPNRVISAARPGLVRSLPLGPASDLPATAPRSAGVQPDRVVTGTAGIMAANVLSSPAPAYPAQASAAQVQGEVVVEAIVGREGDVIDTRVVSGPLLLREAALQAVQRWRYRPYEVDGKPAEIATMARLEFRLGKD